MSDLSIIDLTLCDDIHTALPHPAADAINDLMAAIRWQIERESAYTPRDYAPAMQWRGKSIFPPRTVVINDEVYERGVPEKLRTDRVLTDDFSGAAQYELVIDNAVLFTEWCLAIKPKDATLFWAKPPWVSRRLTDRG
ncbi:MAG: hypothetical protein EOO77_39945, partial [Oxalobacteraceae bacterium]